MLIPSMDCASGDPNSSKAGSTADAKFDVRKKNVLRIRAFLVSEGLWATLVLLASLDGANSGKFQ